MQKNIFENCPLCQNSGKTFHDDEFYLCDNCLGIFRPKRYYLTASEEKSRYEKHNNDVNDIRYQQFVSPITSAVLKEFSPKDVGLDFGAGTGPVISKMLLDKEYTIKQYDPFFHNYPDLLKTRYNYIVCCEVIEHFYDPQKEFGLLKRLLKPKGILYCMTHIYSPDIPFANWYYKKDPTHVFIYQKETFEWIKNQFDFSLMTIDKRLIRFVN
jgi:SAM-dependent methyltransferase